MTASHGPMLREEMRKKTPQIHQQQMQQNTPVGTTQEEVQEGHEQEAQEPLVPE